MKNIFFDDEKIRGFGYSKEALPPRQDDKSLLKSSLSGEHGKIFVKEKNVVLGEVIKTL
jgi:hypothetical protein